MRPSYLQNHYSVELIYNGYRFITDSKVEYYLTFIEYPAVEMTLATKLYVFNIERNSPKAGQNDVKVRNTVLYVIDRFFCSHEDALITVSDISDRKQDARKRLLASWFDMYNDGRLVKMDRNNIRQAFNNLIENNFYC